MLLPIDNRIMNLMCKYGLSVSQTRQLEIKLAKLLSEQTQQKNITSLLENIAREFYKENKNNG